MGIIGAGMMIWYIWRCTRDQAGFEKAFGADWSDQILPEQARHMVKRRWSFFLKMKASPEPSWERDIAFWTTPDTERKLFCDIWRPGNGDVYSLAFVYLHGSTWWGGDKDFFTRSFFRHLVAQGHIVMDVAYRLCPEVDIYGMIGDVKRTVAWTKANASRFGVNPKKIILGGGYIESPVSKKSRSRRAPYEKPMEVSGELNARLAQCGKDRYIVEDRYTHGLYEEEIAQKLGMNVG